MATGASTGAPAQTLPSPPPKPPDETISLKNPAARAVSLKSTLAICRVVYTDAWVPPSIFITVKYWHLSLNVRDVTDLFERFQLFSFVTVSQNVFEISPLLCL